MSSSGPSKAVSSEDIIAQKTDLCVSNAIVKTGIGFGAGVVLSVLLFKRRSFPVWLGTGFGLGSGYTDCERSFNPLSVPGVRIVSSTSPSAPPAAKTTLERLQQRTGEVFGQARANVEPRAESIKDQAVSKAQELKEQAIDKGNEALGKAKSEAKKIENKFPIHSPIEQRESSQDCLVCRVTGVVTMGGLGGYALLEAYRLGAFTRKDGISSKSLQKLTNGKPATSRAHATLLALFGAACCVGAVMRASV